MRDRGGGEEEGGATLFHHLLSVGGVEEVGLL